MSSSRELDIVLFGATGVTGVYVVEELHRSADGLRWGVAGRNVDKLRSTLRAAAKNLSLEEGALDNVPIIVADVANEESLRDMAKRTRLVLNTVGPYRFFGRPVVKACIASGTHHIDVSGEPQYLEQMQIEFYDEAREKGIVVLGSCGFDSIPAEICLMYMREHFEGDLDQVESFVFMKKGPLGMKINYGTWQSAMYGLAHASELVDLRRQAREKLFTKPLPPRHTRLDRRNTLFWSDVAQGWCLPFLGSDRSVMIHSEMFRHQLCGIKPVQIQTYLRVPGFFSGVGLVIVAAMFGLLSMCSCGRWLLEKFPGFFSAGMVKRGGPTREQAMGCSFVMTMRGRGWREKLAETSDRHGGQMDRSVTIRLDGPDPAYVTTAMCMVQVAVVVLKEKEKMIVKGGVLSPGVALDGTSYMERVLKRGFRIAVLSDRD
ncbi:saccharopine dehydrogenase-like oxidoreductase [Dermacentor silvarum]|uniref:saccharopine dehydrogenase-like oxidoreductase n=1 Tax=Dermacentor silvarum TaxID=543639 RepID=UPI00189B2406|nr:saccharopine dehydrogenase-like oxidoreductase [Dermacentor silvarum]